MLWRLALLVVAALWCAIALRQAHKTMPPGTRLAGSWQTLPAAAVEFIADTTATDAYGRPAVSQAIFDQVLTVVRTARNFVVLDYCLFNDQRSLAADAPAAIRALSQELRDALIEQHRAQRQLQILFITDPVNTAAGVPSNDFQMLRAAGVDIVVTDIRRLRDSSFLYASLQRLTTGWWPSGATRRSWLASLLDNSNHRRNIIADDGRGELTAIIGSADPHDASSTNSNMAVKVSGPGIKPLLASELAVARFSGWDGPLAKDVLDADPQDRHSASGEDATLRRGTGKPAEERSARMGIATESGVRNALLEHIDATTTGDSIDIAMCYLSERAVIESLLAANARGARVRLILDPNKDGSGEAISSIPNGPVASELVTASDGAIHVRWYRTHGEQFHSKLVMVYGAERLWFTLGSADLTRRNLDDHDLTANIAVELARGAPLALQMNDYFETLWSNRAALGIEYTADFGVYADPSQSNYWLYRVMEWTGLASF